MPQNQPPRYTQLLEGIYEPNPRPQAAILPPPLPQATVLPPPLPISVTEETLSQARASEENTKIDESPRSPGADLSRAKSGDDNQVPGRLKRKSSSSVTSDCNQVQMVHKASPWIHGLKLGELTQGACCWSIRAPKEQFRDIVMFKEKEEEAGRKELDILTKIFHPNVVRIRHAYSYEGSIYLGFEYCRHTLHEMLHVHLKMQEAQIKVVARSVFDAIQELSTMGMIHGNVVAQSIRICNRRSQVVLADFEYCTHTFEEVPNTDLEALAVVLVECMNGQPYASPQSVEARVEQIRAQRVTNQVFGVKDAERWSGSKQLVDFLDELLNSDRAASKKFDKPHDFIVGSTAGNPRALLAYTELIPLECYSIWKPG